MYGVDTYHLGYDGDIRPQSVEVKCVREDTVVSHRPLSIDATKQGEGQGRLSRASAADWIGPKSKHI